jgi:tetratricopeptide (TPR) repeat protein
VHPQNLESLAGNILRQTVSPRQQNAGGRIFDISRAHCLLRRTGPALALSAQLIIWSGIGDLAKAEDPPSLQVISACRIERPADLGAVPKGSAEVSKGLVFVRAAHPLMVIGAFDRAIEQFDQAIKLDPTNPRFYFGWGQARLANHQLSRAVETSIVR